MSYYILKQSKRFTISLLFILFSLVTWSQNATLSGIITDEDTREPLIGVNVIVNESSGSSTDIDGRYSIPLAAGTYRLTFRYISYETKNVELTIGAGEQKTLDIALGTGSTNLDEVVISVSKFKRTLEEETQSVDVIQTQFIKNTNAVNLADIAERVPGLQIVDGQASIRGGSGYAYGAGSRVMLVVDGQPLLSADRNDIKWNYVPVENIEQVEVLKGSASLLYGASALNGVIHIKTADPKDKPETNISLYTSLTDRPRTADMAWWGDSIFPPYSVGVNFVHRRKWKTMDLVVGGNLHQEKGFRLTQDYRWGRLNFKTRFRPEKHEKLSFGVNGSGMLSREGLFILWENSADGALVPISENTYRYLWYNIDPWMTTFDKWNNKHSLKTRFYGVELVRSGKKNDFGYTASADYQIARSFDKRKIDVIAGLYGAAIFIRSPELDNKQGGTSAAYAQVEKKWNRLSIGLGTRFEYLKLDTLSTVIPSTRVGMNYQAGVNTFLRASYGFGYRLPSAIESFLDYDYAGTVRIFSNPSILPEVGWTSEFGLKRKVKLDKWKGFVDLALFWSEYKNMVEFSFGTWGDGGGIDAVGFQSINLEKVRIAGFELGINGNGKIKDIPINIFAGYTYTYPIDLKSDTTLSNVGNYVSAMFSNFETQEGNADLSILKYRFRHTANLDLEAQLGNFTPGINYRFYSFMENIDDIFNDPFFGQSFEFIQGIQNFRELHNGYKHIFDARLGYDLNDKARVSAIVKNILNTEYSLRPGMLDRPRNYTLQFRYKF